MKRFRHISSAASILTDPGFNIQTASSFISLWHSLSNLSFFLLEQHICPQRVGPGLSVAITPSLSEPSTVATHHHIETSRLYAIHVIHFNARFHEPKERMLHLLAT